ncbi:MAG: glycosyltransferase family 4 protein [Terriglobales bacterium]|jgi:glycosyltransferase involved in cell wall biosynthesis
MRIAVWHNLPSGGAKRALYDQVRGLVARGHEVEAWCPPTADQDYLPLGDFVREHVVPLRLTVLAEQVIPLSRKLRPLYWSTRLRLRAMDRHCLDCARQIHAQGFDLLFAASCMFFHTPQIARHVRIPRVLYLQEPNRPVYESSPELPWVSMSWTGRDLLDFHFWERAVKRKLKFPGIRLQAREERISAMAFDRILVNSFFSRESVLRAFGVDSKVCYLGVDTERFACQNRKRESFVVCVAALLPNKNIELLVASLAAISSPRRPKLVLICNMISQPYLNRIQNLADKSGVDFELKHRITDAELIDLLNRAWMMLYAPRLEPFGYAPLEANACGLPVIAVAEGGVRETIQDGINGLLVEHEPHNIAEAIELLLADDALHQRLSHGARQVAQSKWSLDSSVDRLERRLKEELSRLRPEVRGENHVDSLLVHPARVQP